MGKLGKETKTLLIAITAVCLISFLLAGGIATLLAKNYQQELLLHDYGVAGHLLNNEKELSISAFTSQPNENDIERGRAALASIGYDETSFHALSACCPDVPKSDNVFCISAVGFPVWGNLLIAASLSPPPAHRAFSNAENTIRQFLDGNTTSRIECSQAGDWYSLFHAINEMAAILSVSCREPTADQRVFAGHYF